MPSAPRKAAAPRVRRPVIPEAYPHVRLADAYAEDVVKKRILACRYVRLACERYQRDRAREKDPDWPYRLDYDKAARVCRFMELLPHTKGKWARRQAKNPTGHLLKLEAWQCFRLVNVFGWLRKVDGTRRFREAMTVVPRKNGKSAESAGVGLYMFAADGEVGAEVYSGATSEKQAWEVFGPARIMAQGRPDLIERFGIEVNASNINIQSNSAKFEPIIGKPGDGASPHCSITDEYHEHLTSAQFDTMVTGMGAREQPLAWIITTAGDNMAGPCYDKVLTGRKILEGVIEDEEKFYIEYTIDDGDDWTSEAAIIKANPNIDVSVNRDFLASRQREAIRNTREQGRFKTKHLNLWVNARSAYFNMQAWKSCRRPEVTLESLEGRRCQVGMDLASKVDIAALQLLFELDDGNYATFGKYYLPEDIIEEPGKDHYRAWALADPPKLILTPGNMIDFDRIEEDLDDIRMRFTVDKITFDPSQATMLVTHLMNKGVAVTQFEQTARNYSEPMKTVAALIDAGRLWHDCEDQDPMTWMMSNVTARIDAKDQVYPRKEKDENKIDGPVSLIMAMSGCLAPMTGPKTPYGSRDMVFLD